MRTLLTLSLLLIITINIKAQVNIQNVLDKYADSIEGYGMVALVAEGTEINTAAIGMADDGVKMKTSHLFCIGSITKTHTAAVIFKLQERGLLNIDSPYSKYVTIENKYIDPSITVRQLMNHSSGIADFGTAPLLNRVLTNPTKPYTSDYCLSLIDTVSFERGTKHSYSNSNYLILALLIEQVMEQPLPFVYQDLLFKPYQLSDTYPYFSKAIKGLSHPIFRGLDLFEEVSLKSINDISIGDGNIVSSAKDVYTFFNLLLKERKVLEPESLQEMTDFEKGNGKSEYGCGIFRKVSGGKELLYHTGRNLSYIAECIYMPSEDKIVVVLTNNMDDEYIDKVVEELLGVPLF